MKRKGRRAAVALLLLAALAWAAAALAFAAIPRHEDPVPAEPPIIRGGDEARLLALVEDVGFERPQPGGLSLDGASIERQRVTFFVHEVARPDAPPLGALHVTRRGTAEDDRAAVQSQSFDLVIDGAERADVRALLQAARQSVVAHDRGGFFVATAAPAVLEAPGSWTPSRPLSTALVLLLTGALLLIAAIAALRLPSAQDAVVWTFVPTHLLPALIQLTIYGYWSLHWSGLAEEARFFVVELPFAYALDAAISLLARRTYRLGVGPVPIVLSTNLLILYPFESWHLAVLAITVAIASRSFLVVRGRHLFNPSALGLATTSLIMLALPSQAIGDRAHELMYAPHMTELMVVLAMVAQLRVPVVLATLSAALAMTFVLPSLFGSGPWWGPILLVLLLLMTDPKTLPQRPLARVLVGLLVGVLLNAGMALLRGLELPDFHAKAIAVVLGNAATLPLDRLALDLEARWPKLAAALQPRWNRVHTALWLVFALAGLTVDAPKRTSFRADGARMAAERVPLVRAAPGSKPSCEDNPMYCELFRVDLELAAWRQRGGGPG